jgi:transposase
MRAVKFTREGKIGATCWELDSWMRTLPRPWTVAMEATIFTGWIYDHLLPHATQVKVAHSLMLRAIAAAKKNDRIDAGKVADCLRCDFLPECHVASTAIRDRRRTLRYRHLLVRQVVQMKNLISRLLMETGVSHNKKRLHKVVISANCSRPTKRSRKKMFHVLGRFDKRSVTVDSAVTKRVPRTG